MKLYNKYFFTLVILVLLHSIIIPSNVFSRSWNASLAIMPMSAEKDEYGNLYGAYVDLIRALDKISGSKTNIIIAPFKRSILNLINNNVDFHIPLIEATEITSDTLSYAFSSETLFKVPFVLYTNKNKALNLDSLNNYTIATDIAHTNFFPFKTLGKSCLSCVLEMVDRGRIDGFIFAQNEIDPFIKELKLKNIHRQLYQNFDVKILIPKGDKGKDIDKYFSDGIKKLKQTGEFDRILKPIVSPYIEWQQQ